MIADEHGLTPDGIFQGESDLQLQRLNVYFVEGAGIGKFTGTGLTYRYRKRCFASLFPGRRYVPRAILVDLDPSSVNNVLSGAWGRMFKPDNVAVGKAGTGNNWAKGYYTEGAELISIALDLIRTEAEACDLIQGLFRDGKETMRINIIVSGGVTIIYVSKQISFSLPSFSSPSCLIQEFNSFIRWVAEAAVGWPRC